MEVPRRRTAVERGRVRFTAAERSRIVEEFRRSGLTRAKFAPSVGVSAWTLSQWASRERMERGGLSRARLDVQVFDPNAPARGAFELIFSSKLSLRVPAGFDGDELRRLISILSEPC